MTSSYQRITVFSILIFWSACKTSNPYFCEGELNGKCPDAEMSSTCTLGCSGDTPVCDINQDKCVQCTPAASDKCSGTTTICDNNMCVQCTPTEATKCRDTTPVCLNNTCQPCTGIPGACGLDECMPGGECVSDTNIAYVAPNGTTSNNMCTKQLPCLRVSDALARNRPYVKFMVPGIGMDTTTESATVNINTPGRTVTFVAEPGAKLTRTGQGQIVTVSGNGTSLSIYGLSISGATGSNGIGISTSSGSTLIVSQSTISGNSGGGISITDGQFNITNNFIVGNGTAGNGGSDFGGVKFNSINTAMTMRKFEFNTVADNHSNENGLGGLGFTGGVRCTNVTQQVTFSNNIVVNNDVRQVSDTTSSNCLWTYSDIGPQELVPAAVVPGIGNFNIDPPFVDPGQNNYHIQAMSAVRNMADPNATLAVDFDGDARPQPQGTNRDVGADEVP